MIEARRSLTPRERSLSTVNAAGDRWSSPPEAMVRQPPCAGLDRRCILNQLPGDTFLPTREISDEDTLEFVCALPSEHLTPGRVDRADTFLHQRLKACATADIGGDKLSIPGRPDRPRLFRPLR